MPKNIIICCDGTNNEIKEDLSNVMKLYRLLKKDDDQIVFYDPGIGTFGTESGWGRLGKKIYATICLATGVGLDKNVLRAYDFLVKAYQPGDRIYLFGFSRGAYTVRVLAGFLKLIGLLRPEQINLSKYAFKAYKLSSQKDDLSIAWGFAESTKPIQIPIYFLGVWDTVSSVLIPKWDRIFFRIDQQKLPYTRRNPIVENFRQAIAIDEKRRMFRINRWEDPQEFDLNNFNNKDNKPQDIKQVWFAGDHSDIGGGYPEKESGLAKFSLKWMVDEAKTLGLQVSTPTYNRIVLGVDRQNQSKDFVAPDLTTAIHRSLSFWWKLIEWLPRQKKYKDWPDRKDFAGLYIPWGEPRFIESGSFIHSSVIDKINTDPSYRPVNMPSEYQKVSSEDDEGV